MIELDGMRVGLEWKPLTFYAVIWMARHSMKAASQMKLIPSIQSIKNKWKTFLFNWIHWMEFHFIWWMRIKKYYNSISRQSGIVHKDKAMRQLDLDLLQWLMRLSTQCIPFISINWIALTPQWNWFEMNGLPFARA